MKKILIMSFLFLSFLRAEGTYSDVYFTDVEENATIYLCNYYSYSDFRNIRIDEDTATNIVNTRIDGLYESVEDIDDVDGIETNQLHYLKQKSHLIDWNVYTDDFGLTLHQTNFLFGLSGLLIGFIFLFGFIQVVISEEYHK